MILKLVLWCIAGYGMTQIIVESMLFKPIRSFFSRPITKPIYLLLNCFMCTGAWLGFLLSAYWYSPVLHIFQTQLLLNKYDVTFFIDGMILSAIVWELRQLEGVITGLRNKLTD